MLSNDLKFLIRTLWRRKLYSIIIILSLTTGFTCTNLLVSFLVAELNADSFHFDKERKFQLFSNDPFSGTGNIAFIPEQMTEYL